MYPRESGSQRPSSAHRNPADLDTAQSSHHAVGEPSELIDTARTTPVFQQGILAPGFSWPGDSAGSAGSIVQRGSARGASFPVSLHSQNATTPSFPGAGLPEPLLDPETSFSCPVAQSSFDSVTPAGQQLPVDHQRGLGITSYPMSVTPDAYFAGSMQQNTHQHVWANRPFQPLHPQSGQINQQFPPSSAYPSSGFSAGYQGQPSGTMQGYQHQESHTPYLAATPDRGHRQIPSPSPSLARSVQQHSAPGTPPLSDQTILTSSPDYTMNQPAYYFPDAPSMPSSYPSSTMSVSPQAPSMVVAESIYSSPESGPTPSDAEPQARLLSQRPRPQCWDHGCNGREFSTFSNLLRHQRERSGVGAKAECPHCGAVFTRTTARNIHVAQDKCKSGRESSPE